LLTRAACRAGGLVALAALQGACGHQPREEEKVRLPTEIVDLSPVVTEDLPLRMWGHKALSQLGFRDTTEFVHVGEDEPFYYRNSYLTLFNHAGPHVDSPNHMASGGKSIDEFPLTAFMGPLRVFDLRDRPKDQPLRREEFMDHGIEAGDVVVAFVGYSPPQNPAESPTYMSLTRDAAEYLAHIPVRLFGTDAMSVDGSTNAPSGYEDSVHHSFLSRDIPVAEQLVNLERVVDRRSAVFVGFPLKIADGNGSPIRAAALIY